jgi:hypothetical protein
MSLFSSASTASPGAGASEIPVQGHPDWFVVYQHSLRLQTNVCARIMPRFNEGFIFFSIAREDWGK